MRTPKFDMPVSAVSAQCHPCEIICCLIRDEGLERFIRPVILHVGEAHLLEKISIFF